MQHRANEMNFFSCCAEFITITILVCGEFINITIAQYGGADIVEVQVRGRNQYIILQDNSPLQNLNDFEMF